MPPVSGAGVHGLALGEELAHALCCTRCRVIVCSRDIVPEKLEAEAISDYLVPSMGKFNVDTRPKELDILELGIRAMEAMSLFYRYLSRVYGSWYEGHLPRSLCSWLTMLYIPLISRKKR
jgi:hypothetical protein